MVKYIFQGSYCTFSKCSLSLTHCRVNFYSFSFPKFSKTSSKFYSFVDPQFLSRFFFAIIVNKCTSRFLAIFFILFASTVLSDKSGRTNRYFTPLLTLASLSTYARFIHQISFLNLANAFILLNLQVARVNSVYKGFE